MGKSGGSDRRHARSRLPGVVGLVVAGLLLMSCGGGSGEGPSVDPSRTPVLPSSTADSPSADSSSPESPSSSERPSESPAESPTRSRSPRSTATVTTTAEASKPAESPSASEDGSEPADDSTSDSTDVPAWAWWLLALAILVALVATIILVRRRRRAGAWAAEFTAAGDDVAWFSKVLLPQLLATGSIQQVGGGWAVGESRVAAAEDRLTALEASAPDDTARMRARALRDAVRSARQDVQRLVAPAVGEVPTGDLIAVGVRLEDAQAAARLGMP